MGIPCRECTSPPPACLGDAVFLLAFGEQIVDRADPVEQAKFVAEVQAGHKLSSVTFADDYPVELHNWGTEFPIYGTKYTVGLLLHTYSVL